jgi:thioesterase domain-containing protein
MVSWLIMCYATKKLLPRALGLKPAQPTTVLNEDGQPLDWGLIEQVYKHISKTYRPKPLNAKGVLFRAEPMDEVIRGTIGEDLGWAGAFGGGLEIIPVKGDHLSMIRSAEHNTVLAQKTRDTLNRIKSFHQSAAVLALGLCL